jgi:hypothetical protein
MQVKLSASSIKTLSTCSWLFYYKYHLHGPDTPNFKTLAGSACHKILEVLSNKKHKKYIDELKNSDNPSIYNNKTLERLAFRILNRYNLEIDKWAKDLDNLVIGELTSDFYHEEDSEEVFEPEYEFIIDSEKYKIRGFIDSHYKKDEHSVENDVKCIISDYKSQAKMFTEEELENNIQAAIYQLAIFKNKGLKSDVHFKLLRHNKTQIVEWPGEDALNGLINYFEYLADYLKDYNIKKATSNLAANDKDKRWLCGYCKSKDQLKKDGTPYFSCPARWKRDIYYVKNKEGEIKYSTFDINNVELKNEGDTFEVFPYFGCPAFQKNSYNI